MWKNQKGAALMQVLLITAILAGMATMLLRNNLTRTTSARKTRRTVSASVLIQACMAEVNALWAAKTVKAYNQDLTGVNGNPCMYCTNRTTSGDNTGKCSSVAACVNSYECQKFNLTDGPTYQVKATIRNDSDGKPQITYEVTNGAGGVADL